MKTKIWLFLIIIMIIIISIGLYFIFKPKTKDTYDPGCTDYVTCLRQCQDATGIIGVWSSIIGCGQGSFDMISLGSALPDYYDDKEKFFSYNIQGDYSEDMKGQIYLISIGGSNATKSGWSNFLTKASQNTQEFYDECKKRYINGVDFDIEEFPEGGLDDVYTISKNLKQIDKSFIVMYTILLGYPDTFAKLLPNNPYYDYLTLMLYNGGMYYASGSGAGCDWDGWAEIFLSKGKTGCSSPLYESLEDYAKKANLDYVDPSKVILGVIVDTDGPKFTTELYDKCQRLYHYKPAGVFIWVIPGFADPVNTINNINTIASQVGWKQIDPEKCKVSDTCKSPKKPCDGTCECIATACGKQKQGVTDLDCISCTEQTYWPCDQIGFCECK